MPSEASAELLKSWGELAKGKQPIIDSCIAGILADTLSGFHNPQNELQKKTVQKFRSLFPNSSAADLSRIANTAKTVAKWLDNSPLGHVPGGKKCNSGSTPQELASALLSGGSPLGTMMQALSEPLPAVLHKRAGLGLFNDSKHGCGIPKNVRVGGRDAVDVPRCFKKFSDDGLKLLSNGDLGELLSPWVSSVEVTMPTGENTGQLIRKADLNARRLEITMLDGDGGEQHDIIDQNVPLESPDCLVRMSGMGGTQDPPLANQIFVTDVAPGQVLTFWGSGFVGSDVTLAVQYTECDIDDVGRLVPRADYMYVANFDETTWDVQGSEHEAPPFTDPHTWANDYAVVTWPAEGARDGLYRVTLKFKNEKQNYTKVNSVNCFDCSIDGVIDDYVQSQTLWFVVLPPANKRAVRLSIQDVTATTRTHGLHAPLHPEETNVEYHGNISSIAVSTDHSQPLTRNDVLTGNNLSDHVFSSDGDSFLANFSVIPIDGTFQPLNLNDFVVALVRVDRIIGPVDRAVWGMVLWAFWVAFLVLLSLVVIGVGLVGGAALVALAVYFTLGAAVPAIVAGVAALMGTLLTAIWVGLLPGGAAVISGLMAALPVEVGEVAQATPSFNGGEIAFRMSPLRFHRRLWIDHGIERNNSFPNPLNTSVDINIQQASVMLTYDCRNDRLKSEYSIQLSLDSRNV